MCFVLGVATTAARLKPGCCSRLRLFAQPPTPGFPSSDPRPALTAAMIAPAKVTIPSARTKVSSKKRQRRYASTISSNATTTIAERSATW